MARAGVRGFLPLLIGASSALASPPLAIEPSPGRAKRRAATGVDDAGANGLDGDADPS